MKRILIVENDYLLADTIKDNLETLKVTAECAYTLSDGLSKLEARNYDVVLLDRLLGDGDGLDIAAYLNDVSYNTKVVIISNIGDLENRLSGLKSGADLYLPKPFDFRELRLHIRKLLMAHKLVENEDFKLGEVRFSDDTGILRAGDLHKRLRRKEADILKLLIIHKNQTVTRDQIIEAVWGSKTNIPTYSTIDAYIRKLRVALGDYAYHLKTIRGFGYSAIE